MLMKASDDGRVYLYNTPNWGQRERESVHLSRPIRMLPSRSCHVQTGSDATLPFSHVRKGGNVRTNRSRSVPQILRSSAFLIGNKNFSPPALLT